MRRVSLVTSGGLLALLATTCRSPPTRDEVLSDFQHEIGPVSFMDCKYGAVECVRGDPSAIGKVSQDFSDAGACLVAAWQAPCRPSMASLTWNWRDGPAEDLDGDDTYVHRDLFIVPDGDGCRMVVFESSDDDSVTRLECSSIVLEGVCGVLEPGDCRVVAEIETSPVSWE